MLGNRWRMAGWVLVGWGLSSCSTIHFHRHAPGSTAPGQSEWHHDGILRLVEFSEPVDLKRRCERGRWQTVRVEKNPLQVLVTGVASGLYDPWDVAWSCSPAK